MVMAFAWLGHGLGGYQGGLLFDLTGNYTFSFANGAIAGLSIFLSSVRFSSWCDGKRPYRPMQLTNH